MGTHNVATNPDTRLRIYDQISSCKTLQELKDVLESIETVYSRNPNLNIDRENMELTGKPGSYWANCVEAVYNRIQKGFPYSSIPWNMLTREYGIRDKAMMISFYDFMQNGFKMSASDNTDDRRTRIEDEKNKIAAFKPMIESITVLGGCVIELEDELKRDTSSKEQMFKTVKDIQTEIDKLDEFRERNIK